MSVRETAGHLIDGFGSRTRAYVQVQNGCDHRCTFCIIPFGRGAVALGAGRRGRGAGPPPRGARLPRDRADRRRHHVIRRRSAGRADARRARAADPEARSRAGAAAPVVHRPGRGGRASDARHRRRGAPDAAPASVDAGRRRHDPQAHEAPPQPRRRRSSSAREVLRMRPDTVFGADLIAGFPDRDRRDVRELPERRRRLQPHLSARVPVLAAPGHAGRAHAAG